MSRCLTDRGLLHLHVGGGTTAQQAHADACDACAIRVARLRLDVRQITQVLAEWPAPRVEPVGARRGWWPAWGAALIAAATLLWVASGPGQGPRTNPGAGGMEPAEASGVLHDVSMAMFSIGGDPAGSAADPLIDPGPPVEGDLACGAGAGLDAMCLDHPLDVTL
jgi:hypothetical protein